MQWPPEVADQLDAVSEEGNELFDDERYREAIEKWSAALELLPEPRDDWEATTWLSTSIGDAHYQLGQHEQARECFLDALNGADGQENPFIHYRLGQTLVALGQYDKATESLLKAYMLDGERIFNAEDDGPEYLQLLKDRKLVD